MLAIDGSASPRKPKVVSRSRSAAWAILLVACRSSDSSASSRPIPQPLSSTRISARPPSRNSTSIRVAPASSAFSTSSLTTAAGRSTTSPGGDLVGDPFGQDADLRHAAGLAGSAVHRSARAQRANCRLTCAGRGHPGARALGEGARASRRLAPNPGRSRGGSPAPPPAAPRSGARRSFRPAPPRGRPRGGLRGRARRAGPGSRPGRSRAAPGRRRRPRSVRGRRRARARSPARTSAQSAVWSKLSKTGGLSSCRSRL